LLEVVTHPIATNPSPVLRQYAQAKGWQILEIFKDMQDAKS
jgi:phosphoserine phosphatase